MNPKTATLGQRLAEMQKRWLASKRPEQELIYAKEFGAPFASEFAKLPLHGAPLDFQDKRPRALVSLLGMSWQPVALMAAFLRPERILVLGTKESLGKEVDGEKVFDTIVRVSGLDPSRFEEPETVSDHDETEIYDQVRAFMRRHRLESRQLAVDPTGGKKSMSVAAGLAGFLEGAWLVYVDYGKYVTEHRIPLAGTEYPRLLKNPLDERGDLELDRIRRAFDFGSYAEAETRAQILSERVYQPRLAEAHLELARAYRAWNAFRFADAVAPLKRLVDLISLNGTRTGWEELVAQYDQMRMNLRFLEGVVSRRQSGERPATREEGLPFVLNHYAAARRAFEAGEHSLATMLLYSTVEKLVDLCLWTPYGLDDEKPDYARLEADASWSVERYHENGRGFFGKKDYRERALGGPIQYANGIVLLATLEPSLELQTEFGNLKGIAAVRNKCEFEHGLIPCPKEPKQFESFFASVRRLLSRLLGGEAAFEGRQRELRFPRLGSS